MNARVEQAGHQRADAPRVVEAPTAPPERAPKTSAREHALGSAETSAWAKSAVRAVAFAESRSARVIGISGIKQNVGASSIAAAFAQTYASYGKRILYVEASALSLNMEPAGQRRNLLDLGSLCTAVSHNLFRVDLSELDLQLPPDTAYFRDSFAKALNNFDAIVVDLPCANSEQNQPQPASFTVSAACASTLLVCVTGRTTQSEIRQYMASSKISGTNIEGILLNDFRLPLSNVLNKF